MPDYQTDLPAHMSGLALDEGGRPVPEFVQFIDGKPDFRIMSRFYLHEAVTKRLCWVCGNPLGAYSAFTAGPMCLVNLNSAEPPSHYDCALYSATHCPFLTNPNKVRREAHLPEGADPTKGAGIAILRNPGVTALIVTKQWTVYEMGGLLFNIGTKRLDGPEKLERVEWYCEGRAATRAEVEHSIETGIPALVETCHGDPTCLSYLQRKVDAAKKWLPDA